jgi:hypothetical protein
VPYREIEQQRRAQRESVARRRAAARAGSTSPPVEPAALPPVAPSPTDLSRAGEFLGLPRLPWESYEDYHERLRQRWSEIRSLLD